MPPRRGKSRASKRTKKSIENIEVIPVGDISDDEYGGNYTANSEQDPDYGVPEPPRKGRGTKRPRKRPAATTTATVVSDTFDVDVIPVGDISDDEYGGNPTAAATVVNTIDSYSASVSVTDTYNSRTRPDPEDVSAVRGCSPTPASPVSSTAVAAESEEVNLTPKPVKKKATKRGLAKKLSSSNSDSVRNSDSDSSLHQRDVYSKPVNTMKAIYEQNPTAATIPEIDVDDEEQTLVTKAAPCTPVVHVAGPSNSVVYDLSDDEADVIDLTPQGPTAVRSPTPPPEINLATKAKRMNKKLKSAFNALVSAQENLKKPKNKLTPPTARNRHFSDVMNFALDDDSPKSTEMIVKVRHLSIIHRFNMKKVDTFQSMMPQLSKSLNELEHELFLFFKDKPLGLKSTPRDVGLTVADIIECYCIKSTDEDDSETINVLVQNNQKRTQIKMCVKLRQPLRELLKDYAEKMSLDVTKLRLLFDGEDVEDGATPMSLEMEEDEILDVLVGH